MTDKNRLQKLYANYDPVDCLSALSITSIWLPNITSQAQHVFIISVLLNMKVEMFRPNGKKIATYKEFKEFITKVYEISPSFPMLDDYSPETDWGEVKYYLEGDLIKMLYGSDISNSFDYLKSFELCVVSLGNENKLKSSCINLTRSMLKTHELIINSITTQKVGNEPYPLGQTVIPSMKFWKESVVLFKRMADYEEVRDLVASYRTAFGTVSDYEIENFGEELFSGRILTSMIYQNNEITIPVLPRRWISHLINSHSELILKEISTVERMESFNKALIWEVSRYASYRGRYQTIVSTVNETDTPDGVIFCVAGVANSGKTVIAFDLLQPPINEVEFEDYLNNRAEEENKAISNFRTQASLIDLTNSLKLLLNDETDEPELKIYSIIPLLSVGEMTKISLPKSFPSEIIFLQDFLGIIDEVDGIDTLSRFLTYWEGNRSITAPMTSLLDFYGSFVDSNELLIAGANEPTYIYIDFSWGSNYRFNSLKEYYTDYPIEFDVGDPRTWLYKKIRPEVHQLISKDKKYFVVLVQVGHFSVHLTSPAERLSNHQFGTVLHLAGIIEDFFVRHKDTINSDFVDKLKRLNIVIFPSELLESEEFAHLKILEPLDNDLYRLDSGILDHKKGKFGIRLVYNSKEVENEFNNATNRAPEVKLAEIVLNELYNLFLLNNPALFKSIKSEENEKTRYSMKYIKLPVRMPTESSPIQLESRHFKKAKKVISQLAKKAGYEEGTYSAHEAKVKINKLILSVENYLDAQIREYGYVPALYKVLANLEKLSLHNWTRRKQEEELEYRDIDYDIIETSKERFETYIKQRKNHELFIEKLQFYKANGAQNLDNESMLEILAVIDWLFVLYSGSDIIHHSFHPIKVDINRDFLIDIIYPEEISNKMDEFVRLKRRYSLGLEGNPNDKVDSPIAISQMMTGYDEAFLSDYGFTVTDLIVFLNILANWKPNDEIEENEYYVSDRETIINTVINEDKLGKREKVEKMLDFFTLNIANSVDLHEVNKERVAQIRIWEVMDTPDRYTLKPILETAPGEYVWGAFSIYEASKVWSTNDLPQGYHIVRQGKAVQAKMKEIKNSIEDMLEVKAYEIMNRFTQNVEKNVFPHKRDRENFKTEELGDYDVLAYLDSINVLISIDCNDLKPPMSLAESKNNRDKFFKDRKGKIGKMIKRHEALQENYSLFDNFLKWGIKPNPCIISVLVTRRHYWWTFAPAEESKVKFVRIDDLESFVSDLITNHKNDKLQSESSDVDG